MDIKIDPDQEPETTDVVDASDMPELRDDNDALNRDFVKRCADYVEKGDTSHLKQIITDMHIADIADIIEALNPDLRIDFITLLGDGFDYEVLTELDDSLKTELTTLMPNVDLAKGMASLDTDDAVHILEDMEEEDQAEILSIIPAFDRLSLERSLDYPEDTVGRRLQSDFIAIPPYWSVGQTIDYLR